MYPSLVMLVCVLNACHAAFTVLPLLLLAKLWCQVYSSGYGGGGMSREGLVQTLSLLYLHAATQHTGRSGQQYPSFCS
jgi:hypothetical protein